MVGDPMLGQCCCSRYKGKVNSVLGIHTGTRQETAIYIEIEGQIISNSYQYCSLDPEFDVRNKM
uniref:Uncharacterized protein n=1 Tax=Solanum lycopersicum TaxID=4081 RepID=A0A3Q7HH67_SOLLC